MARPRTRLHPDDYVKIEDLAARGCGHTQIARSLGIDAKTFRERLKDDEAAAAAYSGGKAEEELVLVSLLRKRAEQGDGPAAMFLLKARHGYRDRGETDGASQPGVQVSINIPAPLSAQQYARLIEAVPIDTGAKALSEPVDAQ
jgi:hypothetical protein